MELSRKAKYRIKAWSTGALFLATLIILAQARPKLGPLILLLSFVPGLLFMALLWPDILSSKPMSADASRTLNRVQILIVALVLLAWIVVELLSAV